MLSSFTALVSAELLLLFFDNCFQMVTAHSIHMAYGIFGLSTPPGQQWLGMQSTGSFDFLEMTWLHSLIHSQSQDCVGAKLQCKGQVQFFQFKLLSPDAMKEALLIVQAWHFCRLRLMLGPRFFSKFLI